MSEVTPVELDKLRDKVIAKVKDLLSRGHEVEFLDSEEHRNNIMKVDKIMVCNDSIERYSSGGPQTHYEPQVYLTFEKYPILSASRADAVRDAMLKHGSDATEEYLHVYKDDE